MLSPTQKTLIITAEVYEHESYDISRNAGNTIHEDMLN